MEPIVGIIKLVPPALPRKPVAGTHFTLGYSEALRWLVFTKLGEPASTSPLTGFQIKIGNYTFTQNASRQIAFTPFLYPDLWSHDIDTFTMAAEVRAVSALGVSAPENVTLTITQDQTYYISGFSYSEERDFADAGPVNGRQIITVPSFYIQPGQNLHYYSGPLAYIPANYPAIHSDSSPIVQPSTTTLTPNGLPVGTVARGMLLLEDVATGRWIQASPIRSFTVLGLIDGTKPVFSVGPATSGTGVIGTSATVTYTHNGTSTPLIRWLRGTTAISGANSASYNYVAADDNQIVTAEITARNAFGDTIALSNSFNVKYAAPTVSSPLADQSFTQDGLAVGAVAAGAAFTGSGLTFSLTAAPAGVTIDPVTGEVSVPRGTVYGAANTTVRAINSGGYAEDTWTLAITSVSTPILKPTFVQAIRGNGNTLPSPTLGQAGDWMVVFAYRTADQTNVVMPDISGNGFSGDELWVSLYNNDALVTSSGTLLIAKRKIKTSGPADFAAGLGTFTGANVVACEVWRGAVDIVNPVVRWDDDNETFVTYTTHVPSGDNSAIVNFAGLVTGITGQAPGLRTGDENGLVNTGSGTRMRISHTPAAAIPIANQVLKQENDLVTTGNHTDSVTASVEIKGAATGTTVWPALPDPTKFALTVVTDPAEASANGFAGVDGVPKAVIASGTTIAWTTVSGNISLVQSFKETTEIPAPSSSNAAASVGTFYGTSGKTVGTALYPRWYFKLGSGASALYKLAVELPSFIVPSLDAVTVGPVPTLDASLVTAAKARNYARYDLDTDDLTNTGYPGPACVYLAAAVLSGDASCRSRLLGQLRQWLTPANHYEPPFQMGFSAQHESHVVATIYLASRDNGPSGVWTSLTSTEQSDATLLMRLALINAAACIRPDPDSQTNIRNMLGRPNYSTEESTANPNFRISPRAIVMICAEFFGGVVATKAWMDAFDETQRAALITSLSNRGYTNAIASHASGRPSGAPTLTQVVSRTRNLIIAGGPITDAQKIWRQEMGFTYGSVVQRGYPTNSGSPDAPGRAVFVNSVANVARFLAIEGLTGVCHEMNAADPTVRSSMRYNHWAKAVAINWNICGLVSGQLSISGAANIAIWRQVYVGNEFDQLATQYGWKDTSHAKDPNKVESSNWTATGKAVTYGAEPRDLMANVIDKMTGNRS